MGYTLQRLGGCVIQTPCCFASTILETPQNFSAYAPETAPNVVHMSVQCSVYILLLYVQVAGLVRVYILRYL